MLQKHIDTADLNKEELTGSQTDSWESSMGLTCVSARRPDQSKGPLTVEPGCIPGSQKDLGSTFPMEGYSLNLEAGGYSK